MSQATASAISSGAPTRRNGVIASIRSRKPGLGDLVTGHVGCGEAGRDGVDPDALWPDLGCETPGEALDRALLAA